jgi:hypothetical protein
MDTL